MDMTLVSLRLKNTIRTLKLFLIIKKAEKQLMNECVGIINNSRMQRDKCTGKFTRVLDKHAVKEYQDMIERTRGGRLQKLLGQQRSKFNRFYHKSKSGPLNDNISNMYTNGNSNTHCTTTSIT